MNEFTCPECKGTKGKTIKLEKTDINSTIWEKCYYCNGTGFASDDDTYKEFWRE